MLNPRSCYSYPRTRALGRGSVPNRRKLRTSPEFHDFLNDFIALLPVGRGGEENVEHVKAVFYDRTSQKRLHPFLSAGLDSGVRQPSGYLLRHGARLKSFIT